MMPKLHFRELPRAVRTTIQSALKISVHTLFWGSQAGADPHHVARQEFADQIHIVMLGSASFCRVSAPNAQTGARSRCGLRCFGVRGALPAPRLLCSVHLGFIYCSLHPLSSLSSIPTVFFLVLSTVFSLWPLLSTNFILPKTMLPPGVILVFCILGVVVGWLTASRHRSLLSLHLQEG
ncbi:hypothetical protein V1520DRAFT_26190 [Lipomyces starkeyi]